MKTKVIHHLLQFDRLRGTSRGWLQTKPAYYLAIRDEKSDYVALGEAGLLPGLSVDDRPDFSHKLEETALCIEKDVQLPDLSNWPSIQFAVEMALAELKQKSKSSIVPEGRIKLAEGIVINGLVWMGNKPTMRKEIDEKIELGFTCIKLKIGAIDFKQELDLIKHIRTSYDPKDLAIRLDANGAFSPEGALDKLDQLAVWDIESIEQPIRQGQHEKIAKISAQSPIPIALDEELIGIKNKADKAALLHAIKPKAIVLKPSLLGGMSACDEWIELAEKNGIGWWITSALESNVGLNAIAQYTASKNPHIPQGLGTGMLYQNNIPSPLVIAGNKLKYDFDTNWEIPEAYVRF